MRLLRRYAWHVLLFVMAFIIVLNLLRRSGPARVVSPAVGDDGIVEPSLKPKPLNQRPPRSTRRQRAVPRDGGTRTTDATAAPQEPDAPPAPPPADDDVLWGTVPVAERGGYTLSSDRLLLWAQVECGEPEGEAASSASDEHLGTELSAWMLCRFAEIHARTAIAGLEQGRTPAGGAVESVSTSLRRQYALDDGAQADLARVPWASPAKPASGASPFPAEPFETRVGPTKTAPLASPRIRRLTALEKARSCFAVESELPGFFKWARRIGRDAGDGAAGFEPQYPLNCDDEVEVVYPVSFAVPAASIALRHVWRDPLAEGMRVARSKAGARGARYVPRGDLSDEARRDAIGLRNSPAFSPLLPPGAAGSGRGSAVLAAKVHDFAETYPKERASAKSGNAAAAEQELSRRYSFDASLEGEERYAKHLQRSLFGLTKKRGGWDTLRHYELLAAGCVPYMYDLLFAPSRSMSTLPKVTLAKLLTANPAHPVAHLSPEGCDADAAFASVASEPTGEGRGGAGLFGTALPLDFGWVDSAGFPAVAAQVTQLNTGRSCTAVQGFRKFVAEGRKSAWSQSGLKAHVTTVLDGAAAASRIERERAYAAAARSGGGSQRETTTVVPHHVRQHQLQHDMALDVSRRAAGIFALTQASFDDRPALPALEATLATAGGLVVSPLIVADPVRSNQRDYWVEHVEEMHAAYRAQHPNGAAVAAEGAAGTADGVTPTEKAKSGKGRRSAADASLLAGRYAVASHRAATDAVMAADRGIAPGSDWAVWRRGKFRFLKNGHVDRSQHDVREHAGDEDRRVRGFDTALYTSVHEHLTSYTASYLSTESLARAVVRTVVRERNAHLMLSHDAARRVVRDRWPDGVPVRPPTPDEDADLRFESASGASLGSAAPKANVSSAEMARLFADMPHVVLKGTLVDHVPAPGRAGAHSDPASARIAPTSGLSFAIAEACRLRNAAAPTHNRGGAAAEGQSAGCQPTLQPVSEHGDIRLQQATSSLVHGATAAKGAAPAPPRPLRLLVIAPFAGSGRPIDYQQAALVNGLASLRARLRRSLRAAGASEEPMSFADFRAEEAVAAAVAPQNQHAGAPTEPAAAGAGDAAAQDSKTVAEVTKKSVARLEQRVRAISQAFPGPADAWISDLVVGDAAPTLTARSSQWKLREVDAPSRDDETAAASEDAYLDGSLRVGGFPGGIDAVVFPFPEAEARRRGHAGTRAAGVGSAKYVGQSRPEVAFELLKRLSPTAVEAVRATVGLCKAPHTLAGVVKRRYKTRAAWKRVVSAADADLLDELVTLLEDDLRNAVNDARKERFEAAHGRGYAFGFRTPRPREYFGAGDVPLEDWDRGDRLGDILDVRQRLQERRKQRKAAKAAGKNGKTHGSANVGGDPDGNDGYGFGVAGSVEALTDAEMRLVKSGAATQGQIHELRRLIEGRHFDAVIYAGVDTAAAIAAGKTARYSSKHHRADRGGDGASEPTAKRTMAPPATLEPLDDGGVTLDAPLNGAGEASDVPTTMAQATDAPTPTGRPPVDDPRLGRFSRNDVEQQARFEYESAIFDAQVDGAMPLMRTVKEHYARREVFVIDGNDDRFEPAPGASIPADAPGWAQAHDFVTKLGRSCATMLRRELHDRADEIDPLSPDTAYMGGN